MAEGDGDVTEPGIFWVHMASFTVYNLLIGYLLRHGEEQELSDLILYAVAMGTHMLVNDYGLRHHHQGLYHRIGRWILAAAVMSGWAIGAHDVSEAALAVIFSLLAGSIILNVLKEELPEERQSRYWIFTLGVSSYAVVLLSLSA